MTPDSWVPHGQSQREGQTESSSRALSYLQGGGGLPGSRVTGGSAEASSHCQARAQESQEEGMPCTGKGSARTEVLAPPMPEGMALPIARLETIPLLSFKPAASEPVYLELEPLPLSWADNVALEEEALCHDFLDLQVD